MQLKKKPESNLEFFTLIFLLIGFIASISVSIIFYEKKSYDELTLNGFGDLEMEALEEEDIEITRPEEEKPPPPPEPPPEVPEPLAGAPAPTPGGPKPPLAVILAAIQQDLCSGQTDPCSGPRRTF